MTTLLFKGSPVLPEYHNHGAGIHVAAGRTFDTDDQTAASLQADFPGLFVKVEPEAPRQSAAAQHIAAPPADKQVKSTKRRGG